MNRIRQRLCIGGFVAITGILAACGASPTNTPVATVGSSSAPTVQAPSSSAAASTSPRPSSAATASGAAGSPTTVSGAAGSPTSATASTPTRPVANGSPVVLGTSSPTRATPVGGTPGTPTLGTVTPLQALRTLQATDSHREKWAFTGVTVAGLTGDVRPAYDFYKGDRKVSVSIATVAALEAYQVGGVTYLPNGSGGFVAADAGNPLGATAQTFLTLPDTFLNGLLSLSTASPSSGTTTLNGQQVAIYAVTTPVVDLGIFSSTLQGQRGMAATTLYVDAQGTLVALESKITSDTAGTTIQARLDVSDINRVPEITVPR